MPLSGFHPVVARWFAERLGEPTGAQREGWDAIRAGRHTLISAPTGSGKTLAAFLFELDLLLRESLAGDLPDETRVLYVSPLKALSADIHRNLAEPRREIRRLAEEMGFGAPRITAAVRSGDTPAGERAAMLKHPPHILVTTPESLYLLLTSARSREMLRTVRTVIVDEIHAVLESRRGAHLALSLERLAHVAQGPIQRIGLSATMEPIEEVGEWLVGAGRRNGGAGREVAQIVQAAGRRSIDLALELPDSPLEAVMSAEVWGEVYARLVSLIEAHRTTLVFVNTRRLAERVARQLADRLGEDAVTAHHGSLAKEVRLDAESRLKDGKLRALVATASLELGIDIGHVDLVCQLGTTRRISTLLQRVGRSGHTVGGTPRGRLFPLTRDELVECTALLGAVHEGKLDRIVTREMPLDVLSQQLVAEAAAEDWQVDELFELVRRAWPYRRLERPAFDEVISMLSRGFETRRGRRGALLHHDTVHGRLRGRRGARLTAVMSGGAIPDNADYRVVLEPEDTFIGSVNEDFAIESLAGDIFQLGNLSWRILQVQRGVVRVEDARGQPPNIPFWIGEAPARRWGVSVGVGAVRREIERELEASQASELHPERSEGPSSQAPKNGEEGPSVAALPQDEVGAHGQLVAYLAEARRMLGALPTQDTLIAERFFDESGGMQLILHAPFGSRVNRAWGLALRKRFCRQFNFELQAAATEEAVLLSLGPQHSFPLESVFRFLHPDTVGDILVQALLDAPMFGTHWRWNASIALAMPRNRGGRKVPPQIQRMEAEDLLAAVFPDAAACLENIPGDREVPDHPLVRQTLDDCLREVMDVDGLIAVLRRIYSGEIRCIARDLPEPSPLAAEILNARPYAFLDDAPLEERRTQAVYTRRAFEPSSGEDLGALDAAAIERVRDEAWPEIQNADELHDALLTSGFLTEPEGAAWAPFMNELAESRRAVRIGATGGRPALWVAAERLSEVELLADASAREPAVRELVRGRIGISGPVTAAFLASLLDVPDLEADAALIALEGEGVVLRGRFSPRAGDGAPLEWCERRLLARIHRYTLNRLRAEIEPVTPADYMRFLFAWQRVDSEHRVSGLEGLAGVIEQLDGFELPAAAWESDVLASRINEYDPSLLDTLSLTGRVAWAAGRRSGGAGPIRSTPIALYVRGQSTGWASKPSGNGEVELSSYAARVREVLEQRGASFFHELVPLSGLLTTQVESALAELAGLGLVTSDSFAGLRALITPSSKRKPLGGRKRRHRTVAFGLESAGRWSLTNGTHSELSDNERFERTARVLLRRYGVMFRRLLAREPGAPAWRDLLMAYRRLEARGEIRGGRFVSGMPGEQFALPEAVSQLRAVRRAGGQGRLIGIGAADPANLTGIVTSGDRIATVARSRILYRDGVPVLAYEGGEMKVVEPGAEAPTPEMVQTLVRRQLTPALRARLALSGVPVGNAPPRRPARRRSQRKVASQARPREPVE
jgi:ATP-dependent Lhr-like helicase